MSPPKIFAYRVEQILLWLADATATLQNKSFTVLSEGSSVAEQVRSREHEVTAGALWWHGTGRQACIVQPQFRRQSQRLGTVVLVRDDGDPQHHHCREPSTWCCESGISEVKDVANSLHRFAVIVWHVDLERIRRFSFEKIGTLLEPGTKHRFEDF